ncbi:MAG: VWA domain-containing protein, partial [Xanthobacteraceae bacterium]
MQFARALRAAGLPVGPGKAIDAVEAVKTVGIGDRDDFYWTLHAVFVQRREQREIFDQAFHIFWRNPQFLQRMMSLMLPQFRGEDSVESHREISPRVADALRGGQAGQESEPEQEEMEIDAALTFSSRELLQRMDFEKMTLSELEAAKKAIAGMRL